jgi:hypothetical protein
MHNITKATEDTTMSQQSQFTIEVLYAGNPAYIRVMAHARIATHAEASREAFQYSADAKAVRIIHPDGHVEVVKAAEPIHPTDREMRPQVPPPTGHDAGTPVDIDEDMLAREDEDDEDEREALEMSEKAATDQLKEVLEAVADSGDFDDFLLVSELRSVETFKSAGVLTHDRGLVITLKDRTRVFVTIAVS